MSITGGTDPDPTDPTPPIHSNGIAAGHLTVARWVKSRLSNPSGNCVEIAELLDGAAIAVRNSRDPDGPALIFTRAEIDAFVRGAAAGDFDTFIS